MSIENSPGFRSAQAAWENKNPYDDDCTCLDDYLFSCDRCGEVAHQSGGCPECFGWLHRISDQTHVEDYPADNCPRHGYTDEDAADDAREHDNESRMGY